MRKLFTILFLFACTFSFSQKGAIRATTYGVFPDGKIYSNKINALLELPGVEEIIFEWGETAITNNIRGRGKTLTFFGGASIVSKTNDTLFNFEVNCSYTKQCFDESVTVLDLVNIERSPMWFGAKADYSYHGGQGTDNSIPFEKAIISGRVGGKIKAPGNSDAAQLSGWYRFSRSLIINRKVELYGDGKETVLLFDGSKLGIRTRADETYLHDFYIRGNAGGISNNINSQTAHGIWVNGAYNRIERVWVSSFDGDGIRVAGDVFTKPPTNANFCRIRDTWVYGCGRAGYYSQGGDASGGSFTDIIAEANAIFGYWGNDFLGSTIINPGMSSNVIDHNHQKTLVIYKGTQYWCYQDSKGQEPGKGWPWVKLAANLYGASIKEWDSTTQYLMGGSMAVTDGNSNSTIVGGYLKPQIDSSGKVVIVGGYLEGDQPPPKTNGRSIWIGGFMASNGRYPGAIGANGTIAMEGLKVYTPNASEVIRVGRSGNNQGAVVFESEVGYPYGFIGNSNRFRLNWSGLDGSTPIDFITPPNFREFGLDRQKDNHGFVNFLPGIYINKVSISVGTGPTADCNIFDIVFNAGGPEGIAYWQCIEKSVNGNFGKWQAYKAVKN